MIEVLTTAIVSNVLVLGILGFLSKNLVTHLLTKDIKNHQNQLEIEKIRFQASFGWVYEKQATVITELYDLILELEGVVNNGIDRSKWNDYQDHLGALRSKYHKTRIFIPEELDGNILSAITIGRKIMSQSLSDPHCEDLADELRASKDLALIEMRKLLAVVGKSS